MISWPLSPSTLTGNGRGFWVPGVRFNKKTQKKNMKSAFYSAANSFSRSRRAHIAESEGRMPATRAAKSYGFKSAAALASVVTTSEWHHVGKFANAVDYYDVQAWIDDQDDIGALVGVAAKMTKTGRQTTLRAAVANVISLNLSCPAPTVTVRSTACKFARLAYYRTKCDPEDQIHFRSPKHLSSANLAAAVDSAAQMGAQIRLDKKRRALRQKIAKQLASPVYRQPKYDDRCRELIAKFGSRNSKFIKTHLRKTGQPLTEQAWIAAARKAEGRAE